MTDQAPATPPAPLDTAAIRAEHRDMGDGRCTSCIDIQRKVGLVAAPWPCLPLQLLDALDAERERAETAERDLANHLESTNNYNRKAGEHVQTIVAAMDAAETARDAALQLVAERDAEIEVLKGHRQSQWDIRMEKAIADGDDDLVRLLEMNLGEE